MRISDWSSDVCSSDLEGWIAGNRLPVRHQRLLQGHGIAVHTATIGEVLRAQQQVVRQRIGGGPLRDRLCLLRLQRKLQRRRDPARHVPLYGAYVATLSVVALRPQIGRAARRKGV